MVPCKFCGPVKLGITPAPKVMHIPVLLREGKPSISVNCPSCCACTKNYKHRAEAIWAWNCGEHIPTESQADE